uniref:3-hydroxyacyl-CoA dehydrogenase NAD-binding domain-containing protein n=1 Tax=Rhizobium giardinii TaxID=56731 RepID=UPI001FD88F15
LQLRKSKHAQARIHLFLSGKGAFRFPGASGDDRRVVSVAISGSGKRARAIAALLRKSGLSISTDGSAVAEADLIIDTGDDRKTALSIRRLASLAKSNAIIATTRSRDMDRLANSRRGSADIVGLNFRLSRRRSLVEVTPTAATKPAAVNAVLALLRKTGAQAVVSRQSGLVGERIIAACRAAADDLRRRGVSQKDVKTALFSCGMSRSREVTVSSGKSIDPALRHWLLGEMAREAVTLLSEGIVRQSSDIDLILVHGYGFPDEDGGPIWAAEHILRTSFGVAGGEEEASMASAEIGPTG